MWCFSIFHHIYNNTGKDTGKLWFNSLHPKKEMKGIIVLHQQYQTIEGQNFIFYRWNQCGSTHPEWGGSTAVCLSASVWRKRCRDSAPTSDFLIWCLVYFQFMSRDQLYLYRSVHCSYTHLPQLRGLIDTWLVWTNNSFQRRNCENRKKPLQFDMKSEIFELDNEINASFPVISHRTWMTAY